MWNKFDDYQEGTTFIAWSITIARYKVLSFRKKNKNSKILFSDLMYELVSSQCQEFGEAMDIEINLLKKCMMKLPDRYKQYLLMRYEMSLSYRAIAEKAHISMQAVYKTFIKIHSCLAQCVHLNLHTEDQK